MPERVLDDPAVMRHLWTQGSESASPSVSRDLRCRRSFKGDVLVVLVATRCRSGAGLLAMAATRLWSVAGTMLAGLAVGAVVQRPPRPACTAALPSGSSIARRRGSDVRGSRNETEHALARHAPRPRLTPEPAGEGDVVGLYSATLTCIPWGLAMRPRFRRSCLDLEQSRTLRRVRDFPARPAILLLDRKYGGAPSA